jgi:hypothetical protein
MDKTKQFMEFAKKAYNFDRNNPNMEKEWLGMMSKFCGGICGRCGKSLKVTKIKINFQGKKFFFECGHMFGINQVDDKTTKIPDPARTFRKARISLTQRSPHITASHSGPRLLTNLDELGVTRKFIEVAYPSYQKIKKYDEEASLVDTVAENEVTGKKIFMQVTKLYPADFWKDLHTLSHAETKQDIESLLVKAIERKNNFDVKEKNKIILLIDSWPGFEIETLYTMGPKLNQLIKESGYKEIWVIGSLNQLTFRIDE